MNQVPNRILPQSALDFLDDIKVRELAVSRMADEIADLCFDGANFDIINAKRLALLQIKETIEMDIAGIARATEKTSTLLEKIIGLNDNLFALYASSLGKNDIVDDVIGRYGCRTEDFYGEEY